METWSSPGHLDNFSFVFFNGTDNLPYFNFTVNLLVEIKSAIFSFNMKQKSSLSQKTYDIEMFNSNTDLCQFGKGFLGSYILKFFMEGLQNYSNLNIQCPMKKGYYYAQNFPLPASKNSFLPSLMPTILWQLTIESKAKLSKSQARVRLFNMQIQGEATK